MKKMYLVLLFPSLFFSMILSAQNVQSQASSAEEQAKGIMKTMTIDDKIGQMLLVDYSTVKNNFEDIVNYKIGNIHFGADSDPFLNTSGAWATICDSMQNIAISSNIKIPLLLSTDAIHGHSNVSNATIFPQNIGLGCTRNLHLVEEEGRITAFETAASGIRLVFCPEIAVANDIRWGGSYLSYGENVSLVSQMGNAFINGFNSTVLPDNGKVLGCPKFSGSVKFNKDASELRYCAISDNQVSVTLDSSLKKSNAILLSSTLFSGKQNSQNSLDYIQKFKNNFKGIIITDWELTNMLQDDYYNILKNAINSGVDLFMEPSSYKLFIENVKKANTAGEIPTSRIDDAVKRILTQKIKMGLFKHPFSYPELQERFTEKGSKNIVKQCVRESAVILFNKNNVLPVSKKAVRIHVAGSAANNLSMQCGGWTIGWQGLGEKEISGQTFLESLKSSCSNTKITYSKNGQGATGSEVGIVVIGEEPYADWFGNKKDLQLSQEDINAVMNIKNANVPVVCVLLTGRPLILEPILSYCDAIVAGWLPGPDLSGLIEVLTGDYKPKGQLSVSWPMSVGQLDNKNAETNIPLFAYGSGILSLDGSKNNSPRLISANVINKGGAIELAFSKPISEFSAMENFSIKVNDRFQRPVSGEKRIDNPSAIVLYLKDSIKANQKVMVNFETGAIKSKDGGEVLAFKNFSVFNSQSVFKKIYKIPAMIQAEKYSDQRDIDIQECWDDKGGQAIALEKNEWAEYMLSSGFPGYYNIIFRVQAEKKGELSLSVDGREIKTIKVPATKPGKWTSVEMKKVYISNGKQTFTILSKDTEVKLNWISFDAFVNFVSNQ